MKRKAAGIWLCFLGVLLTVDAGAQIAARYGAEGSAVQGEAAVTFKSAIARWDAGQKELQIGLLPFEVTDEDVKKVSDWRMIFYATVGKKSPDPGRWKDPPYLVIMLRLDGDKKTYAAGDIKVYTLNVVNWKGNSTIGAFMGGDGARDILGDFSFSPDSIKDLKLQIKETKDRDRLEGFRYEAAVPPAKPRKMNLPPPERVYYRGKPGKCARTTWKDSPKDRRRADGCCWWV